MMELGLSAITTTRNNGEALMDKFVNIVDFEVQPGKADEVVKLVSENARKSVETEPGAASV